MDYCTQFQFTTIGTEATLAELAAVLTERYGVNVAMWTDKPERSFIASWYGRPVMYEIVDNGGELRIDKINSTEYGVKLPLSRHVGPFDPIQKVSQAVDVDTLAGWVYRVLNGERSIDCRLNAEDYKKMIIKLAKEAAGDNSKVVVKESDALLGDKVATVTFLDSENVEREWVYMAETYEQLYFKVKEDLN